MEGWAVMRIILKTVEALSLIAFWGCALWLFVVPYAVWGWVGAVVAVLLPGLSHIAALIVGGTALDWMVFGGGSVAGLIAVGARTLHERAVAT